MSRYVEYPPGSGVGAMYSNEEWAVLTDLVSAARRGEISYDQAHQEMQHYHDAKTLLFGTDVTPRYVPLA